MIRVIGTAATVTGERKRPGIPGWERLRNGWRKTTDAKAAPAVPFSVGAAFTTEKALMEARKNFPESQVTLGVTDLPVSASFPDGRVYPRPME